MPKTIKETFGWCLFYSLANPLISSVQNRLAAYPVTDLLFSGESSDTGASSGGTGVRKLWEEIFEDTLNIRPFLVGVNLDRYGFGNGLVSVAIPFVKTLTCKNPACRHSSPLKDTTYKWRNYQPHIECPKCGYSGPAAVKDEIQRAYRNIRLIRWNPNNITIKYNEITGKHQYFYTMPMYLKNQIMLGKREFIEDIPQVFIDALRLNKAVLIESDRIFHMRRPSISRDPADSGWGAPLLLPVLKDVFFLQILRKSQEAVAFEHIVPMRVFFPQVTGQGSDVYSLISIQDWQKETKEQLRMWRADYNHMPVLPFPLGYQAVGGTGKSLLLHQEIRVYSEQIIAGMGVPTSFFYGEAQYSGASVNLRALENEFLGNRQDMLQLVKFIMRQISAAMGIPMVEVSFTPFKMADDIQRASFNFNLANAGYISRQTFLQSQLFDPAAEQKQIEEESKVGRRLQRDQQLSQAEIAGEASLITNKHQLKAQEDSMRANQQWQNDGLVPPPPQVVDQKGNPAGGPPQQAAPEGEVPVDPTQAGGAVQGAEQSQMQATPMVELLGTAKKLVMNLQGMGEVERYQALDTLRSNHPDLYAVVNDRLGRQGVRTPAMVTSPEAIPTRMPVQG